MDEFNWKNIYGDISSKSVKEPSRPLIGITGNYDNQLCTLAEGYYRSILLAGGIPVIILPYMETEGLGQMLDRLDGIVFSGGGDINPLYLDERGRGSE